MRKLVYASLGLLVLLVLVIQGFGGFKHRQDPIKAATTPPPLIIEDPPLELLQPENPKATPPTAAPAESKPGPGASPLAPSPVLSKTEPTKTPVVEPKIAPSDAENPRAGNRPTRKRDNQSTLVPDRRTTSTTKEASPVRSKGISPPVPVVNPLEVARQELARDIVLEKNPALAKLIGSPENTSEYKGWSAEPDGPDIYKVSFTFLDKPSGSTVLYVWQVNLTARTVTPLSYYARKLL